MTHILRWAALATCLLTSGMVLVQPASLNIAPNARPQTLYGVTFDNLDGASATTVNQIATVLTSLNARPTARVVLDYGSAAADYTTQLASLSAQADWMGELIDSSYMTSYTSNAAVTSFVDSMVAALAPYVKIWEVGNEINGNWLSTLTNNTAAAAEIMGKVEAQYDAVKATSPNALTALTFYYEGEPATQSACYDQQNNCPDANNCLPTAANEHGGNDMFNFIKTNFLDNPTAETEKIRLGVNYVLISWYEDGCNYNSSTQTSPETPNWARTFADLGAIFPHAYVGFGERGTGTGTACNSANTSGSPGECILVKHEIDQCYPSHYGLPYNASGGNLPNNYIGGCFFWEGAEDLLSWPGVTNWEFPSGMGAEFNGQIP